MRLIKQPNTWSCVAASAAMLLDLSVEEVCSKLGHDGSEVWFPHLTGPSRRRGFLIQEIIPLLLQEGFSLTPIDADPIIDNIHIFPEEYREKRLFNIMMGRRGIIEGANAMDRPHACAWYADKVYDPAVPRIYDLFADDDPMAIETFWLLLPIASGFKTFD